MRLTQNLKLLVPFQHVDIFNLILPLSFIINFHYLSIKIKLNLKIKKLRFRLKEYVKLYQNNNNNNYYYYLTLLKK